MVDNSTSQQISTLLIDKFNQYNNLHIITQGNNYGIAYAQNIGIKYGIEKKCNFFIEMDQDTTLPCGYVENIYKAYQELISKGYKVGGIGPLAISKKNYAIYNDVKGVGDIIEVEKTLSSGFFYSREVIEKIGLKNEDLFIDLVDWEWCWRARSKGYKIFIDKRLTIMHMLGRGHKNFLFFKIGVPDPIRHYYQYRNSIILSRLNYVPVKWKLSRFIIHIFKLVFFLFYDQRLIRLKYAIKGIKDGLFNKTGKLI